MKNNRRKRPTKNLLVFLGSRFPKNPVYAEAAAHLGKLMVEQGWRLIYGGSNRGLMGVLAAAVLKNGGEVIEITPEAFFCIHNDFRPTQQHVLPTIRERKDMMHCKADAIIAFPGGLGTLEELVEVQSWNSSGFLDVPMVLLNTNGIWDDLLSLLDRLEREGFLYDLPKFKFSHVDAPEEALKFLSGELKKKNAKKIMT